MGVNGKAKGSQFERKIANILSERFKEHTGGRRGINTSTFEPENIVSIYKISNICKFIEYNNNVINTINKNDEYNWRLLENFNE